MSKKQKSLIERRQFLIGAAGLVGSVAVAHSATAASTSFANAGTNDKPQKDALLSIAYFDGSRLQSADRMANGDSAMVGSMAKLRISGSDRRGGSLNAVDVHYLVATDAGNGYVAHLAWTRASGRAHSTSVRIPVSDQGIKFSLHHNGTEMTCTLTSSAENGTVKLREGTYIIVAGSPSWALLCYEPSSKTNEPGRLLRRSPSGFSPARVDYITIEVQQV
jgi:hypothetical protein